MFGCLEVYHAVLVLIFKSGEEYVSTVQFIKFSRRPKMPHLFSFISSFLVFIVSYYHKVIFFHPICEQNKSLQKCWKTPSINLMYHLIFWKNHHTNSTMLFLKYIHMYSYIFQTGRLLSTGSQRVRYDRATKHNSYTWTNISEDVIPDW